MICKSFSNNQKTFFIILFFTFTDKESNEIFYVAFVYNTEGNIALKIFPY